MSKKIVNLHTSILNFLLKWRADNPGFTFALRKSDINERLSRRYWFHGNDDYIAISFWTGIDWQRRIPNLSLIIAPKHGRFFFQVSCRDSPEKEELLKKRLLNSDFAKLRNSLYVSSNYKKTTSNYMEALALFLRNEKPKIDNAIAASSKDLQKLGSNRNSIGFIDEKLFKENLKKITSYKNQELDTSDNVQFESIRIKDFGPIKNVTIKDIPANCKWIFFTGENGSGKTNILRAIAIGLVGRKRQGISYPNPFSIKVSLRINGKKIMSTVEPKTLPKVKKADMLIQVSKNMTTSRKIKVASKGFVAFGPMRLNVEDNYYSRRKSLQYVNDSFSYPEQQLFSTTTPLVDLGFVYSRRFRISKNLRSNDERLKNIIDAITTICESIVDIRFKKTVEYFEDSPQSKNDKGIPFSNLPSGHKSVIAMVSHMMLHLFDQQPSIEDPAELEGVVVIDEIDLHFHPKMQRLLVIKLSEIFPRVQFIVSTHSPIPLLGAPSNSLIFTVHRSKRKGVIVERLDDKVMYDRILPNAILTSPIFGLDNIVPEAHKKNIPLKTLDHYSEIEFSNRIKKELANYIDHKKEKELIKLFKRNK